MRIFWPKLEGLWEKAKRGGAILGRPREYALRVALPSLGAWLAKLGVIAVFLAGYGIPVTFHAVMTVVAGNSIGNTVSVTPGGVGVNQATNAAALSDVTDRGHRDRLLARPAARDHGLEHRLRHRSRSAGRSAGREAESSSSGPTRTLERKAAEQKAQRARRRHPPQSL